MVDNKETTLEFIEDYKKRRLLWDTKHVSYQNNNKRRAAFQELSEKYDITTNAVKNKIKNLRSYFCKEQQKVVIGMETSWFAYKAMSFLWEVSILAPREDNQNITSETTPAIKIELQPDGHEDSGDQTDSEVLFPNENTSIKRKYDAGQEDSCTDPLETKRKCPDRQKEINYPDEYSLFGEYVTNKIRKLNARNRVIAQNKISNILLQLEMDEINETSTSAVEWTTL